MIQRKMFVWLILLGLLAVFAVPVANAIEADIESYPTVMKLKAGNVEGVFIYHTTSQLINEIANVSISFTAMDDTTLTDVNIIQIELQYPSNSLDYMGYSKGSYWQGDIQITPSFDTLTIECTNSNQPLPAPDDYQTLVVLKFTPLCQLELTANPITFVTDPLSTYMTYMGSKYAALSDSCFAGSVAVADYDGFVSILNQDPDNPVELVLEGAADADYQFVVPFYMNSNASIASIQGKVNYDAAKLEAIGFELVGDCNQWDFSAEDTPNPANGSFSFTAINSLHVDNDLAGPCAFMNVTFRVLGDWRGQSTTIGFDPTYPNAVTVGRYNNLACAEAGVTYDFLGGSVAVAEYQADISTEFQFIYADNVGASPTLDGVISMANNFAAGCQQVNLWADKSPLRLGLNLPDGVTFAGVDQPDLDNVDPNNPLDDFFFKSHSGEAKAVYPYLEFYSVYNENLDNRREINPEPLPLISFQVKLDTVVAPGDFAAPAIPLAYTCSYEGLEARIMDEPSCSIQVDCAQNSLSFTDTPSIKYANGELTCSTAISTKPANVAQGYFVRTTFPLTDFAVTVRKDGNHRILSITTEPGVVVTASGSDFVTFGPNLDWVPSVHESSFKLGTITYSLGTITPTFDKGAGNNNPDKDIAPPPTWCYDWTNITFDPTSFLHDATGRTPFMFKSEGNVGTRWTCGGPIRPLLRTENGDLPTSFALVGNYPNPFNPQTTIVFDLPQPLSVNLEVLDIKGRRIATLVDGIEAAGRHRFLWNGTDTQGRSVSSGVYFAVIRAGSFVERTKMILLK